MKYTDISAYILVKEPSDTDGYYQFKWRSIKDNILSNTGIEITPRNDETFTIGHFDAWFEDIDYIAPYTPMYMVFNNKITYFVCSSTCKPNLINNKYFHSFEVFEPAALLSNFLLGSKAFSVTGTNKTDYEKVVILKELIQEKYNIELNISTFSSSLLNKEREFTFGPGTTLYTALSEILLEYDLLPIVSSIYVDTASDVEYDTPLPINLVLDYVDKNQSENIEYSTDEITDIKYGYKIDDYCKFLETETTNVVDRTSLTTWTNLTVRAEDILVNADTCALILPTKVEEIKSIKTTSSFDLTVNLYEVDLHPYFIDDCTDGVNINQPFDYVFEYLIQVGQTKEDTTLYKIMKELIDAYLNKSCTYNEVCAFLDLTIISVSNNNDRYVIFGRADQDTIHKVEVTDYLKEKKEWDNLEPADKPKYMYYESGTNVIKGLYNFYKNDFWGIITGGSVNPWYNYVTTTTYNSNNYDNSSGYLRIGIANGYTPMADYITFDIEATVMVDPVIINEKSIQPVFQDVKTEYNWKSFSRSYDVKANTIEFDKLQERMQLTNDMLGDIELEIELTNPVNLPKLINRKVYKLSYQNVDYFVMAVMVSVRANKIVAKYSLSRTYSRKAEAISVDTQFNATPNPLENIITRPIYLEANEDVSNVDLTEYNYLCFNFFKEDGNSTISINQLYKRFAILEDSNSKYLYCEAVDQYTFDYNMYIFNGVDGSYYKNPVPYVDQFNENTFVSITLAKLDVGSNDISVLSRSLPRLVAGTSVTTKSLITKMLYGIKIDKQIRLYKDARERLTFTIKLN